MRRDEVMGRLERSAPPRRARPTRGAGAGEKMFGVSIQKAVARKKAAKGVSSRA